MKHAKGYYTASTLKIKDYLEQPKYSQKYNSALGYVRGVFDSDSQRFLLFYGQKTYDCWADTYDVKNISLEQLGAIVLKYLKEHPEHWQYGANMTVSEAEDKTFPVTKEIMACGETKKTASKSKSDDLGAVYLDNPKS